jgi:hypothetical protein
VDKNDPPLTRQLTITPSLGARAPPGAELAGARVEIAQVQDFGSEEAEHRVRLAGLLRLLPKVTAAPAGAVEHSPTATTTADAQPIALSLRRI